MALVTACGEPSAPPPTSSPPSATSAPTSAAPPTVASVDRYAPPGFVDLAEVDPTIIQEIRYYTDHNFVGRPIEGYLEPRCLLTEQAAQALRRAQTAARGKGYSLKVYDCYRPLRAGEEFKQWAKRPDDQAMKAEFFPELSKVALFTDGFVSGGRSTHSSGSTVDLTLVALPAPTQRPFDKGEPLTPCTAPAAQRFPDNTIDMGTGYDCFDTRSHTLDSRITGQARQNRLLLRQLMTDAGFRSYANEWWHFRLADDPHPNTYYDFPVARAALR
ncbi:MAG TPA: D-alanyl-D-alanine dipeptidase [Micromonosporaceae bacterium]|nr:D-alanyl-D-alanine dipeptidase [Micromonosporaceae bacterium]